MYLEVEKCLKDIELLVNYPLSLDQVNRIEDLLIDLYNQAYKKGFNSGKSRPYYEEQINNNF